MVVVGGATRLTHAGLSITDWQLIHGVIPPLSDADWQEEFAKYKQIPEFQSQPEHDAGGVQGHLLVGVHAPLLGRIIGLVVLLPLVFLWFTGRLERALLPRLLAICRPRRLPGDRRLVDGGERPQARPTSVRCG